MYIFDTNLYKILETYYFKGKVCEKRLQKLNERHKNPFQNNEKSLVIQIGKHKLLF